MDKQWIVIPDIHGRKFWREVVKGREKERIIFLGDYLDPYPNEGITSKEAYGELLDIVVLKKNYPNNVTLLLGNHDLGYLDCNICEHRQDLRRKDFYKQFYIDNIDLFDIVCEEEINKNKILFSHAGIRTEWVKNNDWLFNEDDFRPQCINSLFHMEQYRDDLFLALSDVSMYRGGFSKSGSVVWTDIEEFVYNRDEYPGYTQIFGHTFHTGGAWSIDSHLWCLDCGQGFNICSSKENYSIEIVGL